MSKHKVREYMDPLEGVPGVWRINWERFWDWHNKRQEEHQKELDLEVLKDIPTPTRGESN
jgi:hypothetical protein